MQLRNGALMGGSQGQLPADRRPAFEEGVLLVFKRWTALCLALDGQWGGSSSADKAQTIYEETLDWFYKKKGRRGAQAKQAGRQDVSQACKGNPSLDSADT